MDTLRTDSGYDELTTRNIGFVTPDEQARLRSSTAFVCGTGGMGGACVMALARAGVGRLVIADIDHFEVSNINRQVFAFSDTVGRHKADEAADACRRINPGIEVEVHKDDWPEHLSGIASRAGVIVNGTDDLAASLHLYRTARSKGVPVIDAYTSPLPSVVLVRPGDPMPEERLRFPTVGKDWRDVTDDDRRASFMRELEYVFVHSSSRNHIDLAAAADVVAGRRSRMSFAPMVIGTGMLMAYEAIGQLLARPTGTDCRGWFLNPYRPAVERPRHPVVAAVMAPMVRRFLNGMAGGA